MDGATFKRFMSYVSGYFASNDISGKIEDEDIIYAEISSDDLYVVSAIFGAYSPNEDTMILAPAHPGSFILPWINYFQMNICEKENKSDKVRSILLMSL